MGSRVEDNWQKVRKETDKGGARTMRKGVEMFGFPFLNQFTTPPARVDSMEGQGYLDEED